MRGVWVAGWVALACSSAAGEGQLALDAGAGATGGEGGSGVSGWGGAAGASDAGADVSAGGADASDPDAAWMCDPDALPLPNEGMLEAPGVGGCPPGMAAVDTFCVDLYEASLVLVFPTAGVASWSPYVNPGTTPVRAVSIAGAVPQAYIDANQAAAACAAAGKRLCSDSEWIRACRGSQSFVYPYGDVRMPGVCNDARAQHPAVEYFGTADAWIWSELDNACIDQLPNSLDPAGQNPGCVSVEGVFDLMGNLHEWTSDPAGTFRGGFYVDTQVNGEGCLYQTTAHDRTHYDYSTGFRCCSD